MKFYDEEGNEFETFAEPKWNYERETFMSVIMKPTEKQKQTKPTIALTSREACKRICDAIGIKQNKITRLQIDLDCKTNELCHVKIESYVDGGQV